MGALPPSSHALITAPLRGADEIRDNTAFEAILWALSRPGEIRHLPEPGPRTILLALVDRECRVHADDAVIGELAAWTGATLTPLADADHVFLSLETGADIARLGALKVGSALYPDDGATVVVEARLGRAEGDGQRLSLSGPGIETTREIAVAGLPAGFFALRDRLCRYPLGFDLFIVDGSDVIGLPRSTRIEVL